MIIGDSGIFAIEFEKDPESLLYKTRVWLNGESMGYYDDPVYLNYIKSALRKIISHDLNISEFYSMDDEQIFHKIFFEEDFEKDKCKISFGESFDDFLVCVYKENDSLCFLWKYVEKPCFSYTAYDRQLHSCKVKYSIFLECSSDLFHIAE